MIGDEPANTDYDPGPSVEAHIARRRYVTCRGVIAGHRIERPTIVGLVVKPIGKPSAGNRHARFDERGWITERRRMVQATALSLPKTRFRRIDGGYTQCQYSSQ